MHLPVYRAFALSLILISAAAHARTAHTGNARCHLKMDDQTRYELTFNRAGDTLKTPIGEITSFRDYSRIQLDADVVEINSTGKHPSWTGNINIDRADGSVIKKDQKNEFVLLLVTELYLQKGDAKGVLTCGYFEDPNDATVSTIEKTEAMPAFFNEARRAALRIQGYYLNPELSKSPGVDTAALIVEREQNFINFVRDDVKKINLNSEEQGLYKTLVRGLEKTQAFNDYTDGAQYVLGGGRFSTSKPEVEAVTTENGLDLILRSKETMYQPTPYRQYGIDNVTESFSEKGIEMLMPGYPVLVKNSIVTGRLRITRNKNGRVLFNSTRASQSQGRVLFYSGTQFVPFSDGQNDFKYDFMNLTSALNEIPGQLAAMGKPMAEIVVEDANITERDVQMDDMQKFGLISEYMKRLLSTNRPDAEVIKEALQASGLEKNPESSTVGMIRIMMAETLRAFAGLPASTDSRTIKAIDGHLQKMLDKGKSGQSKLLAKLMFLDREAVISQFQHILVRNLDVQKSDNMETFLKKVAQSMKGERESKRAANQLFAWLGKQKASFSGFCSWMGVNDKSPDSVKQGLRMLLTLAMSSQSDKDIKGRALHELNEQLARALFVLTKKS